VEQFDVLARRGLLVMSARKPNKKAPGLDEDRELPSVGKILSNWRAPVVWRPSLLAGLIGLRNWIRNPVAAYAREREQLRCIRAYRALDAIGCIKDFEGYPITALPPQYDDLLNLYLLVKERKPRVVLELGGGYSTLVIARAVSQLNVDADFWSVDASEFWQSQVDAHMPDDLRRYVKYHQSNPIVRQFNGETISAFESLPVASANFLYVDGGSLAEAHKQGGDALLLENNAPSDYAILVDGREATVTLLRRCLKGNYKIGPGPVGVQTLFERQDSAVG
jgi:hypothetical protein